MPHAARLGHFIHLAQHFIHFGLAKAMIFFAQEMDDAVRIFDRFPQIVASLPSVTSTIT